jgi:hypothetical protein
MYSYKIFITSLDCLNNAKIIRSQIIVFKFQIFELGIQPELVYDFVQITKAHILVSKFRHTYLTSLSTCMILLHSFELTNIVFTKCIKVRSYAPPGYGNSEQTSTGTNIFVAVHKLHCI